MRSTALLIGLVVLGIPALSAQEKTVAAENAAKAELPSAESILEKFIEVTGGAEAYKKIKDTVAKGVFDAGMKLNITIYSAKPSLRLMELEMPGMGKQQPLGVNGDVVWSYNAMGEATLNKKAATLLPDVMFDEEDWRAKIKGAETNGAETVEGEECYKVALAPIAGIQKTRYFSKTTGLLVRTDKALETEKDIMEETYKDYKKVDGVLTPFQIIQKAQGQTITTTFNEIKNNTDIPKSTFEPPAAVKALLGK